MTRLVSLAGILILAQGAIWAGSITVTGTGEFTEFPGSLPAAGTGPFWNNMSLDFGGSQANIGNFLTNTGAFPANCGAVSTCGVNYDPATYYQSPTDPGAAPDSFVLNDGTGIDIAVLDAFASRNDSSDYFSGGFGAVFGYYDPTAQDIAASEVEVYGSGTIPGAIGQPGSSISPYSSFGLYVTICTQLNGTGTECAVEDTFFSDSTLDGTDTGHQHFALFQGPANTYYVGVEYGLNNASTEGYGDFNDLVLKLDDAGGGLAETPEPATFVLIGAGLLGLGLMRRKAQA